MSHSSQKTKPKAPGRSGRDCYSATTISFLKKWQKGTQCNPFPPVLQRSSPGSHFKCWGQVTSSLMGHQTWVSNFSSLFVSSLQFAFNKSFSFKINCSIAVFTHAQEIKTCYKSNLCTLLATVPVEYASLDTHAESICTCLIWVLLNSARNSCKVFHYF